MRIKISTKPAPTTISECLFKGLCKIRKYYRRIELNDFSKSVSIDTSEIKPISDLRNYTDVLNEVDVSSRVYLTRNGRGEYAILKMDEIDELDKYRAAYSLFTRLKKAEERAVTEGWIDEADLDKLIGE